MSEKIVTPVDTEAQFSMWLKTAQPGDVAYYHQGFLLADRWPNVMGFRVSSKESEALDALANAVRAAYVARKVVMVQKRAAGPDAGSHYLAVRR